MKNKFLAGSSFLLAFLAFFASAQAATFTVTNTGDSSIAGSGSLRRAIIDACATPADDIIEFDAGAFATPQTITLINGELLIDTFNPNNTGSLTINGRNVVTVARSSAGGTPQFGIFTIRNAAIFNNLTITNGSRELLSGNIGGGGIRIDGNNVPRGSLVLNNSTVRNNSTLNGEGGGIYNGGGALTINNSNIINNTTGSGFLGGGISFLAGPNNLGSVTVNNSNITGNMSTTSGGGISALGGGILAVNNSTISDNTCSTGNGTGGGIQANGMLTISGSTITGNSCNGGGGGVRSGGRMTISNSTISNNTTRNAGSAISVSSVQGVNSITNSLISNNTVSGTNVIGGGAITNTSSNSSFAVINSTISGNRLIGGIANNGGGISNGDNLTLTNSTITDNEVTGAGSASGVVTVAGGIAPLVRNTIIAGNRNNATIADVRREGGGTLFNSGGFNLIGNVGNVTDFNQTGDQTGTSGALLNPQLAALANNGGTSFTHALLPNSTALNAGNNALALDANNQPLATDQRGAGFPRINSGTVDIGAFEGGATTPSVLQFSAATFSANERAAFATILVNRSGGSTDVVRVDYKTNDSFAFNDCAAPSATANQRCDYAATNGTLTFAAGETNKTFAIPLTDDFYAENDETLGLMLSNPTGGTLGAQSIATLTIANDDTTAPADRLFFATLNSAQEVPTNNSTATGLGTVLLNAAETQITVNMNFSGLSSAQTAAHIHGAAHVGVNAPVLFNFGTGQITNLNFTVNATQVAQLKAGLFYMNLHTANFTGGEIRGQALSNPVESARYFARQQYHDFLSRVPDQAGEDFWTGQITTAAGTDLNLIKQRRVAVSNAFFFELEYQQTGAYTYRLYREAFGNTQPFQNTMGDMDSNPYCQANPNNCLLVRAAHVPSYERFAADRARLDAANLAATQLALATNFAQRAEFTARYPASQTAEQFVDALLGNIQAASGANLTGQRAALIALFNSGGRGAVLFRLAEDNQAGNPINNRPFIDAEYNRSFVTTQYFGYLRRDADLPGLNFWLSVVNQFPLRSPVGQNGMVCAFITSAEYQQRFNSYFTRTNQTDCP